MMQLNSSESLNKSDHLTLRVNKITLLMDYSNLLRFKVTFESKSK